MYSSYVNYLFLFEKTFLSLQFFQLHGKEALLFLKYSLNTLNFIKKV